MQKITVFLFFFSILFQSCSSLKKAEKVKRPDDYRVDSVDELIGKNISNYNFFIQKADIVISEDNVSTRFLATVKYKIPDSLLISVRARIGYEAARILLTKDTLIISDRINKKTRVGNPADLKSKYGIEPSLIFAVLGDFIIDGKDKKLKITCDNGLFKNKFNVGEREVIYIVDCKTGKVLNTEFGGDIKTGDIYLEFSDFVIMNNISIPRVIDVRSSISSVRMKMRIEKAEMNYQGNIGFKSSGSYKVIGLK